MRKGLLLILSFIFVQTLCAQHFHVEDFREDPASMAARRYSRTDVNDQTCAIIKVRSNIEGIQFDSNLGITDIEERPDGVWLYVSPGERALRFMHQGIITKDYVFPVEMRIASSSVYILELLATTGEVDDPEIETQWLIITSEPEGADLYINDEPAGRTPYQNELPVGTYQWHLESNLYFPDEGFVTLESGDGMREQFHVGLEPDYGTLVIRSMPEDGADVVFNGININETTPTTLQRLPSGEHNIRLSRDDYATTNRQVELQAGERQEVVVDMRPTFAIVSIDTEPRAGIYINDQPHGSGSWEGRMGTGVYTLEARLDKHKADTERIQVRAGEDTSLVLRPEPITGNLRIISLPIGSHIRLNGEDQGTTPTTLRNLLIGNYEVGLSSSGYFPMSEQVTIEEGETAEVNVELSAGMEVAITSEPAGADVFIEDMRVGETPYTSKLAFGSHRLKLVNEDVTYEENITISHEGQQNFSYDIRTSGCAKEVTFVYRGREVTYEIIEHGGLCWMDRNLGASRVPTSSTDSQGYGDLFQWGRVDDSHQNRTSGTISKQGSTNSPGHGNFITAASSPWDWRSPQNDNLWQGEDGINNPCPSGWRVPTEAELHAEHQNWIPKNAAGAYASALKWPVAGYRLGNGMLTNVGSTGNVWSSSVSGSSARGLTFSSSNATMNGSHRAGGMSLRCVRDLD